MANFAAVDFETANSSRSSACALGLVIVRDGAIAESSEYLIKPVGPNWDPKMEPLSSFFDGYNMMIHGIDAKRVKHSPHFGEAWPEIQQKIAGLPLVAHNAAFDIGVLRDALSLHGVQWPDLQYLCTMVLARRTWELPSYKLSFVADAAGIEFDELMHHNAQFDALMSAMVFANILDFHKADNIESLLSTTGVRIGELSPSGFTGCARRHFSNTIGRSNQSADFTPNLDANPEGHLFGAYIAFTGRLDSMTREVAKEAAALRGAVVQNRVTQATQILVIGQQDSGRFRPGQKVSGNMAKATALADAGHAIEIVEESDFRAWLLD